MPDPWMQPGRDDSLRIWQGEDSVQAVRHASSYVTRCRMVRQYVRIRVRRSCSPHRPMLIAIALWNGRAFPLHMPSCPWYLLLYALSVFS